MNEISQIVINPDDATPELLARVSAHVEASPRVSGRQTIKMIIGKLIHPVWHTMVPLKLYDYSSDRIIHTGRKICLFCSRSR